jgi:hypothetical protein
MKLTMSMRRCLILLEQSGEALRVWSGTRGYEWTWRINDAAMSIQVDRCIRAGLLDVASRDRVVLSPLGQRILRQISKLPLVPPMAPPSRPPSRAATLRASVASCP